MRYQNKLYIFATIFGNMYRLWTKQGNFLYLYMFS